MLGQPIQHEQFVMTTEATISPARPRVVHRRSTHESPLVRRLLIGVALAFIALFLVIPLVSVFAQAFARGLGFYFQAVTDPLALSAIRLTLIAAGISVPLNCIFGVAAVWTKTFCSR
jgi:sulfate transport system permease protein